MSSKKTRRPVIAQGGPLRDLPLACNSTRFISWFSSPSSARSSGAFRTAGVGCCCWSPATTFTCAGSRVRAPAARLDGDRLLVGAHAGSSQRSQASPSINHPQSCRQSGVPVLFQVLRFRGPHDQPMLRVGVIVADSLPAAGRDLVLHVSDAELHARRVLERTRARAALRPVRHVCVVLPPFGGRPDHACRGLDSAAPRFSAV